MATSPNISNEAAVGVVGEARVAGLGGETFGGGVVETEVENRVHHAGHGELRAGAHAQQERVGGVAEFLALQGFQFLEGFPDLIVDGLGHLLVVIEEDVTDVGDDGEAAGDGDARATHLREAGTLAAQRVFH